MYFYIAEESGLASNWFEMASETKLPPKLQKRPLAGAGNETNRLHIYLHKWVIDATYIAEE